MTPPKGPPKQGIGLGRPVCVYIFTYGDVSPRVAGWMGGSAAMKGSCSRGFFDNFPRSLPRSILIVSPRKSLRGSLGRLCKELRQEPRGLLSENLKNQILTMAIEILRSARRQERDPGKRKTTRKQDPFKLGSRPRGSPNRKHDRVPRCLCIKKMKKLN